MDLNKWLRYVPLLASAVVVFLSLILLGGLTGLLWHIRTFDWWVKLSPSVLGATADWFVWCLSFLLVLSPSFVGLVRRMAKPDPVVLLTSVILPLLSLAALTYSEDAGATMLVGSGILATYTLISRSQLMLQVNNGLALRVVSSVVFGLLSVAAAGGLVSVLLWQQNFFLALVSGSSLAPTDAWLDMLGIDLETFYLVRPFLTAILFILAAVAFIMLFRRPVRRLVGSLPRRTAEELGFAQNSSPTSGNGVKTRLEQSFPYLVLLGSLALGVAIGVYPYVIAGMRGVLGVDSWYYIGNLRSIGSIRDVVPFLRSTRAVFFVVLFVVKGLAGLSADWVVRLMPAFLSPLLALSTFVLVKEGTGRSPVAALAALLSVLSAQTALGMSAGIINNWFALSIANFMFALTVRSIRARSRLAAAGALLFSLILLSSYAFLWVVIIAEVALVLAASILSFLGADRFEWKREVGILSAILSGSVLVPVALLIVATQLLGINMQGIDPSHWFASAWTYLAQVQPQLVASIWGVFEEALDFAGNRIDLPLLTLLSIVGLLDWRYQRRSFSRIVAAMVFVPIVLTVIISLSSASPYTPMWLTWRGLYIIPFYLAGALGIESVIRRVNGSTSCWRSPSRFAFVGTFVTYVFLSHLSYSLRALEFLILVARLQ
jgi:hypothetical protein